MRFLLTTEAADETSPMRRLAAVATALRQRGHEPVLAVADVVGARELAPEIPILAAPVLAPTRRPPIAGGGYLGLLIEAGFADAAALEAMVAAAQFLIERAAPDCIIFDQAPVMALASFGAKRLPIGDGAHLPPPDLDRLISIVAGDKTDLAGLAREAVMGSVLRVQNRRQKVCPASPAEIFAAATRMVCVLPEFDPFLNQRTDRNVGPLQPLPRPSDIKGDLDFLAVIDDRFAYVPQTLTALSNAGLKGEIYLPNRPQAMNVPAVQGDVTIKLARWPENDALSRATVVVHHGDLHAIETLLAMGRPQVVLATDLERAGRGKIAASRGFGAVVTDLDQILALDKIVGALRADKAVSERAYAWARTLQEDFNAGGAMAIAEAAEALAQTP